MKRSMVLCGFASLCVLMSAALPARAEWTPDGVPVVESSIEMGEFPPLRFGLAPDGQGGAIISSIERRAGPDYDIFAQRIDSYGDLLWAPGGIPVCTAPGDQTIPRLISDGSGGWFILWTDKRGEDSDIYAQRINAEGVPQWATDGVAIHAAEGYQQLRGAIPNGSGGVIVLWIDYLDGNHEYSLDARLIDMNAGEIWTAENIIGNIQNSCGPFVNTVSDGAGGMIIAVKYGCGYSDVRVQRLGSAGELRWGSTGILFLDDLYSRLPVLIEPDGSGGVILGWADESEGSRRLFAQRILSNGKPHWNWGDGGVRVCAAREHQVSPRFVSDGSGGVIVSWATPLGLSADSTRTDIYAQRIDGYGDLLWPAEGIPVCVSPDEQQIPFSIPDGSGGAIIVWTGYPPLNRYVADIYAQHITGEGDALWPSGGLPVCTAPGMQAYQLCVPDEAGGAVIAWVDSRSGTQAGYIQRIDRNGNWGYPAPAIEAVRDVPGDQGGSVCLAWSASRLDSWPSQAVASYSVWRAISPEEAALALKGGGTTFSGTADLAHDAVRPLVRIEHAGSRTYYWMYVSAVAASRLDDYSEIVPTLFDVTDVCDEYHYFQVIAHGGDPDMYWISRPDSGRSFDDLTPSPPAGLAGTSGPDAVGLHLTWNRGTETDLDHYAVYRGSAEGFEPSPGNLLANVADTFYTDGEWRATSRYFFKVAAVDIHGNESACSSLDPEEISGGPRGEIPSAPFLAQNFPNPFNPSTNIKFGLKERGFVSLRIFDATGRLVRVLVEKNLTAGIHEERWNGLDDRGAPVSSGVYFCSLKTGSFAARRKVVLLR